MSQPTKAEIIAQARAKRGMAPVAGSAPAQQAPQGQPSGRVPEVVQRAVAAPRAAPAPAPRAAQAPSPRPANPVGMRPPAREPATQVARVERPEPRRLNVVEVGEDLLRIAGAFARTPQFNGAPLIVTFEINVDQATLGVTVTEAIPGTMHPRFVAEGRTLNEATSKLMRRFREPT